MTSAPAVLPTEFVITRFGFRGRILGSGSWWASDFETQTGRAIVVTDCHNYNEGTVLE